MAADGFEPVFDRTGSGPAVVLLDAVRAYPASRPPVPTTVLWPEHDPLFTPAWPDRIGDYFSRAWLRLVDGAGHFAPLEYPDVLAAEILALVRETAAGTWTSTGQ